MIGSQEGVSLEGVNSPSFGAFFVETQGDYYQPCDELRLARNRLIGGEAVGVFFGFSVDSRTVLTIYSGRGLEGMKPESWLIIETNVDTGAARRRLFRSASCDQAQQLWLEVVPELAWNQPVWQGGRAFQDRPLREHLRFTGRFRGDETALREVEYKTGQYGGTLRYLSQFAIGDVMKVPSSSQPSDTAGAALTLAA